MSGADVTGWQPMTTAPRDGTRVLVWSATERTYHVLSFDSTPPPGWMSQDGDYVVFEDQEPLSHWTALPTPPRSSGTHSRVPRTLRAVLCLGTALAVCSAGLLLENALDLLP